jgi:hypothetical protein
MPVEIQDESNNIGPLRIRGILKRSDSMAQRLDWEARGQT